MNWKKDVSETSKKNVQSLVDIFDKFIAENHKSEFSYDQKIRKEWQSFKKVIEADPAEVEAHNKYVNMLKTNFYIKDQAINRINSRYNIKFQNIQPILMQINRTKLQQIAKKMSKTIAKNNKIVLKP